MTLRRRPFPLLQLRPVELEGVVLDFHWDTERLHSIVLPVTEMRVADLAWHLELPLWSDGGCPLVKTWCRIRPS